MEKEQEAVTRETATDEGDVTETGAGENQVGGEGATNPEELSLLLEDARNKADENWDKLVRAQAELENLRKRHERELANAHKFALERFVGDLLPVRDSMELGLGAAGEAGANLAKLQEGMELTLKLLSDVMERFDVKQIDPAGEPFDPELHQAMSVQPRDDAPPNTVVVVVQKGYTLNGRLVRPAMVIVSQAGGGKTNQQA